MANIYKIGTFKKTISVLNTAEQLNTATTGVGGRFAKNVILYAPSGNSATVYVGDSTVSATAGFPLLAGSSLNLGDLMRNGNSHEYDLSLIYVYGAAGNVVNCVREVEV